MPLYIKDDTTAALVEQLAKLRHISKQAAVKQAVQAELDRAIPLAERVAKLWREHPLPAATGVAAGKAFFDDLAGEA
jgi:antitoxin VapB